MTALIVGSQTDSHVRAVVSAMSDLHAPTPVVLDAPELQRHGFSLDVDELRYQGQRIALTASSGRGWLRRYAPSMWGAGTVAGSLEAVSKRAFLALVGAITRIGDRQWLTSLSAMLAAEDRIVQLEAARSLGLDTPDTVVSSDPEEIVRRLGHRLILKPLHGGYFWVDGEPRAVFTTEVGPGQLADLDLRAAPFVAQELLEMDRHLRVVTVGRDAWIADLLAINRPLDWRLDDEAHFSWQATSYPELAEEAIRLACHLNVGYSSQDWVECAGRCVFLDLNPGGQWLFLPDAVSDRVTEAIARFLAGPES